MYLFTFLLFATAFMLVGWIAERQDEIWLAGLMWIFCIAALVMALHAYATGR